MVYFCQQTSYFLQCNKGENIREMEYILLHLEHVLWLIWIESNIFKIWEMCIYCLLLRRFKLLLKFFFTNESPIKKPYSSFKIFISIVDQKVSKKQKNHHV